jgi:hypothetical protein
MISEHGQTPGPVMRLNHGLSRMVRGTVAGNWLLTFPLAPLPFLHGARQGTERGVRKHGGTPHAMVARVWYVPNETSGFVDQALRTGLR